MYNPQLIERTPLSANRYINVEQIEQTLQQVESRVKEAVALLLVIDTSVHKLNQSMRVILKLSELLLPQVDPDSPLAVDLATMFEQIGHMDEIVRGINRLAYYQIKSVDSLNEG